MTSALAATPIEPRTCSTIPTASRLHSALSRWTGSRRRPRLVAASCAGRADEGSCWRGAAAVPSVLDPSEVDQRLCTLRRPLRARALAPCTAGAGSPTPDSLSERLGVGEVMDAPV